MPRARESGITADSEMTTHQVERNGARGRALTLALLVLLALGLRFGALFHDLWIDEVWTWGIARAHASAWEIFTLESSNSHPLNTLYFHLLGDASAAWMYRLPALAAGLSSVVLAAFIAPSFGRIAGSAAAALFATSFLMTVYSTEARGYALEVMFALIAFLATRDWLERPRWTVLAMAWTSIALGFLSQYLFVHAYAALALWSAGRVILRRIDRWAELRRALVFHSFPLVFVAALWFFVLRRVFNAGSPPWELVDVLAETFGWSLGLPVSPIGLALGIALVAGIVAVDVISLARAGRDEWIFQLAAIVVVPVATAIALKDQYLCPRYFLVAVAFFLVASARVLASLARRGRAGAAAASVLFVAFALGNLALTRSFVAIGRGGYRAAVEQMGREDAASSITVTGNYAFNVGALLDYHKRFLPAGRELEFFARDKLPPAGVEWIVVDELSFTKPPATKLRAGPMSFILRGTWTHFGPSGSDWALYRREKP